MSFIEVFNRIRLETDLQTQDQLAKFLGIKQSSVSGAKKRGRFPRAWIEKVGRQYNLRYEWIMAGEEPKRINQGMNLYESNAVIAQLWYVLLNATDSDRVQLKEIIDDFFQKTKAER